MKPAATVDPLLVDRAPRRRAVRCLLLDLQRWTAAGLIPAVAPPSPLNPRRKIRRKLIDRRDIEAFLTAHKTGGVR